MAKQIKCTCGKLLARVENGTLYLWCKKCKGEVAVDLTQLGQELSKPTG
jgi:phage FluMu protein Com